MKSIVLVLAPLLLSGCLEVAYTPDGVPIVPFDADAPRVAEYDAAGTTVTISVEVWTNRMPGPPPPRKTAEGFPANLALTLTPSGIGRRDDSLLVPAISFWSATGDTLILTCALVRTDGRDPWVQLAAGARPTELTCEPTRRPFTDTPPDLMCLPRVLILDRGRIRFQSLPAAKIGAVY